MSSSDAVRIIRRPSRARSVKKAFKSFSDPGWLQELSLPKLSKPPRRANTDFLPKKLTRTRSYEISSVDQLTGVQDLVSEDIIVAIMGPTGTGKSTKCIKFIQRATNRDWSVGHSLQSHTSEVNAVRVRYTDGISLVLVDTPGFDDTNKSDLAILKIIAHWFKDVYRRDLEISGILYLHRITDNRMGGTPRKNLELFKKLCGDDYFQLVCLMTTMWPENKDEEENMFSYREAQLKQHYWSDIISDERQIQRFRGTQMSAWGIIEEVLLLAAARQQRKILEIQQELVDLSKQVQDTNAGQHLHGMIEELVERQTRLVRRLQVELIETSDPETLRALMVELTDLRRQQEKTQKDLRRMGPSVVERARQLNHTLHTRACRLDSLLARRLRSLHQGIRGTFRLGRKTGTNEPN